MNRNDQRIVAERIRAQYIESEAQESKLDELCRLDREVKRPAEIISLIIGILAALVMGSGMSLVMTDIGATLGIAASLPIGIIVGCFGLGLALINYPIYTRILDSRKTKLGPRILELSESIVAEGEE